MIALHQQRQERELCSSTDWRDDGAKKWFLDSPNFQVCDVRCPDIKIVSEIFYGFYVLEFPCLEFKAGIAISKTAQNCQR